MRRLIVNADDFGLTAGVTRGILDAHRHGIVTSSTVMVNRPIDRDLIARARDEGLPLGLHVNMTLGAPITRGKTLVDEHGSFRRDPRRAAAQVATKEAEAEIEAQVERFVRLVGQVPVHLDSHHHVGLYPPVREAMLGAARRLGVPVRSEDESARARARSLGLRTADHFIGGSGPDPYWTLARTLDHLRRLPGGTSEFMTHPGFFDADLAFSRYGRQRDVEMIGLGGAEARAAVTSLGIQLVSFREL